MRKGCRAPHGERGGSPPGCHPPRGGTGQGCDAGSGAQAAAGGSGTARGYRRGPARRPLRSPPGVSASSPAPLLPQPARPRQPRSPRTPQLRTPPVRGTASPPCTVSRCSPGRHPGARPTALPARCRSSSGMPRLPARSLLQSRWRALPEPSWPQLGHPLPKDPHPGAASAHAFVCVMEQPPLPAGAWPGPPVPSFPIAPSFRRARPPGPAGTFSTRWPCRGPLPAARPCTAG